MSKGVQVKLSSSLWDEMSGGSTAAGENGDRYYRLYMRMAAGTVIEPDEIADAIDILETAELGIEGVAGGASLDFEAAGRLNAANRSVKALLKKLRAAEFALPPRVAGEGRKGQKFLPRALKPDDIIKLGKLHAVVQRIEDRGESVAVDTYFISPKTGRLRDNEPPLTTFFNPSRPIVVEDLYKDVPPTRVASVNDAAQRQKGSDDMAVKVKKSGAKKASSSTKKASSNGGEKRARRTAEDVAALVPAFRKHLQGGGTMRELKAEHGFSDDGPIRAALYRAGFDSKGNPHEDEADSIDASKAAGKKELVALRSDGAPWYQLAYLAGITEGEAKSIVTEAGGPTGRVYTKSEKPAKAEGKAKSTSKAKAGKKAKAKADADPS